jgi:hypothetical protein
LLGVIMAYPKASDPLNRAYFENRSFSSSGSR